MNKQNRGMNKRHKKSLLQMAAAEGLVFTRPDWQNLRERVCSPSVVVFEVQVQTASWLDNKDKERFTPGVAWTEYERALLICRCIPPASDGDIHEGWAFSITDLVEEVFTCADPLDYVNYL